MSVTKKMVGEAVLKELGDDPEATKLLAFLIRLPDDTFSCLPSNISSTALVDVLRNLMAGQLILDISGWLLLGCPSQIPPVAGHPARVKPLHHAP
jgi:hypothetical protein